MNDLAITLKAAVLCDDIRREEQGKFSLIGVYTGGPIVVETPHFSDYNLFVSFDVLSRSPFELRFAISAEGFTAHGSVAYNGVSNSNTIDLILPFFCLHETEEKITFSWEVVDRFGGEAAWDVHIREDAAKLAEGAAVAHRQMLATKSAIFFGGLEPVEN